MARSMPDEMDDALHARITAHTDLGNRLFEGESYSEALDEYWKALALIPEPVTDWEAGMWVYAAIGDCHFYMDDYENAHQAFARAVACPGGLGNWFIHLRLGEAQFELGNMDRAADELARAFMGEGEQAFAAEDPKYLAFLRTKLR